MQATASSGRAKLLCQGAADPREEARVLVVDDDLEFADVLREILASAGYRVAHARSGVEARAMLDQVQPRLIILDLMLPDVDGLVLCSMLKARSPTPIVVCSGTGRRRDAIMSVTPTESRLLVAPAAHPDVILSRDELARQVWGYADAGKGRTIDVHVRRLRVKLGQASQRAPAPSIVSVRGFGYKLVPESPATTAA